MNIDIYTDGGKFLDRDFAAWSFIILDVNPMGLRGHKSPHIVKSGIISHSTSNGAEVLAVAFALEFVLTAVTQLTGVSTITVYSDCCRPVDALNGLIEKWANNGWRNLSTSKRRTHAATNRALSEKDKWVFLYAQLKVLESFGVEVKAIKVPAHTGVYWNEKCDALVKYELAMAVQSSQEIESA